MEQFVTLGISLKNNTADPGTPQEQHHHGSRDIANTVRTQDEEEDEDQGGTWESRERKPGDSLGETDALVELLGTSWVSPLNTSALNFKNRADGVIPSPALVR